MEVYKFRSTDRLLQDRELEEQYIFFASPEQLNDPTEGAHDIVWAGDAIVWENLFRHYLFCLASHAYFCRALGVEISKSQVPVFSGVDESPTPELKDIINQCCNRIFNHTGIVDVIQLLADGEVKVRHLMLLHILSIFNTDALGVIPEVFSSHGSWIPEQVRPRDESHVRKFLLPMYQEYGFSDYSTIESNVFLRITADRNNSISVAALYNTRNMENALAYKNLILAMFSYPEMYIERLSDLIMDDWFVGSFSKSSRNSSVWANYADGHRGCCLIFDSPSTSEGLGLGMPFEDVRYEAKPREVDFFRSIGSLTVPAIMERWYTDTSGNVSPRASHLPGFDDDLTEWRKLRQLASLDASTIKSKDWAYERETRLVKGFSKGWSESYSQREHYDFSVLKGIVFGSRTPLGERLQIMEILSKKCREYGRTDFQYFQAYYSPDTGDIRKYEIRDVNYNSGRGIQT